MQLPFYVNLQDIKTDPAAPNHSGAAAQKVY